MNNTEIFELCETSSQQQCLIATNAGMQALWSTRATTMSCRYLTMLSRRITSVVSNMVSEQQRMFFKRPEKCCTKRIKRNMKDTHSLLRDGRTTTSTEIRCHSLYRVYLPYSKILFLNMAMTKTIITTRAIRPSVRSVTASSQTTIGMT